MNSRGALLALGVLAAFLAIFIPIARVVLSGSDHEIDAGRMRRTYAALALYESQHDGLPAPTLAAIQRDIDPGDLQSVRDQKASDQNGQFSWDAALETKLRSPYRVSWSYRWHWKEAGKIDHLDPRKAILASWWTGAIMRVNVDGSLLEAPDQGKTFESLFGK